MKPRPVTTLLLSLLMIAAGCVVPGVRNAAAEPGHTSQIGWRQFRQEIFAEAARDNKLILLDLEAIWCHWCHVMEKETYSNPKVQAEIAKHFLPVRADQAAYPELATRYQDYGWPATVIIDSKGTDLRKQAGFIPPDEMVRWLEGAVKNPKPEEGSSPPPAVESPGVITPDLKDKLFKKHLAARDLTSGGLNLAQRYIDADSLEYAIYRGQNGDAEDAAWAKLTLLNARRLLDPAWGGMYQYSTHYGWDKPHFEKIMTSQRTAMTSYGYAFRVWNDPADLEAAEKVYGYLRSFLRSPDGAWYTSQDADLTKGVHSAEYFESGDAERRAMGIPAIDKNIYSRENGMAISGIVSLYAASLNAQHLEDARSAARWIIRNRGYEKGGYSHGDDRSKGGSLQDSLWMLRALVDLYSATGEREWIARAQLDGGYIADEFQSDGQPGLFALAPKKAGILKPVQLNEENILAARTFNLLYHYTGDGRFKAVSENALKRLSIPSAALEYKTEPGILIVDRELRAAPLHITIVGAKDDPKAAELFKATVQYPELYKRLDWWDRKEGPLPFSEVEYPALAKAAAFICTEKRCSLPIFAKEGISKTIAFVRK